VAGVFAVLQACSPAAPSDESTEEVSSTLICSPSAPCVYRPTPPAGYVAKHSVCKNWVEGTAKVRNNSRIVTIRSDGTVPIMRAEPVPVNPSQLSNDNFRRIKAAALPENLVKGYGVDRRTGMVVRFFKIGQAIITKEPDGTMVTWVLRTENLGPPEPYQGRLEYKDTCFRNPAMVGRDTAGWVAPGTELAVSCVVEDSNKEWNAYSAYGWSPLVNYATTQVATANDPVTHPHPDGATYAGPGAGVFFYTGPGAALNDINGTERDAYMNYLPGERYCHMIISSGYEVPGAKRPATRTLPAPGIVNGKTVVTWKPVNPNVDIANDQAPISPDPIEPDPPPAVVPIPSGNTFPG
jgi:hypothetical protein